MRGKKGLKAILSRKWVIIAIIVVALIGFDLLNNNKSLINRGIVVGLSIDTTGDRIELNAQTVLPRSGGSSTGNNNFMIFSSTGETMQDAIERLSSSMGVKASFAHCTIIVFGENLLKTVECDNVLKFLVRSDAFADNTLLVASSTGKDVLSAKVPINEVSSYHLRRMMQGVQKEAGVNPCTLKDYFANYYRVGGSSYMPYAVVEDCEFAPEGSQQTQQEAQLLNISRSLVTTREGYAFTLDSAESEGLSFVKSRLNGGSLLYFGDCSRDSDVILLESKSKIKIDSPNHATVNIRMNIRRNEMQSTDNGMIVNALSDNEKLRIIESVRGKVLTCYEKCKENSADVFGVGEHMYRKYGRNWIESIDKDYLHNIELDVNVKITVK